MQPTQHPTPWPAPHRTSTALLTRLRLPVRRNPTTRHWQQASASAAASRTSLDLVRPFSNPSPHRHSSEHPSPDQIRRRRSQRHQSMLRDLAALNATLSNLHPHHQNSLPTSSPDDIPPPTRPDLLINQPRPRPLSLSTATTLQKPTARRHVPDRDDRQLRAQKSVSTTDPNSPPSRSHSHHSVLSHDPDLDLFIDPLPPPAKPPHSEKTVRKFARIRSLATLSEHSNRRIASYHTEPDTPPAQHPSTTPLNRQGSYRRELHRERESDRQWPSFLPHVQRPLPVQDEQMEMERMVQFGQHANVAGKSASAVDTEEQSCYSLVSTFDARKNTDRYLSREDSRDVIQQGYCRMSWFAGLRTTRFLRLIRNELHCYDSSLRKKLWTVILDSARVRIQMRQNKLVLSKLQCGYLIEFYVVGEQNCKDWAAALLRASSLEKDTR